MKENNNSKYLIIIIIVLVVGVICLSGYALFVKNSLDTCRENRVFVDEEDNSENNILGEDEELAIDVGNDDITYDCSFTRTYNMVNTLDGYVSETKIVSYVVVDAYQDNYARTHVVPESMKANLEVGKKYEFTYTLKGSGYIGNMDGIYDAITWTTLYNEDREHTPNAPDVMVTLSIKETDKVGMGQKQEPICGND